MEIEDVSFFSTFPPFLLLPSLYVLVSINLFAKIVCYESATITLEEEDLDVNVATISKHAHLQDTC